MPELNIQYRAIGDLSPYENNPKMHSAEQIGQLVNSYNKYGWTNPILIDEESMILAGHGRWQMAQQLEMNEVPTITIEGLSTQQKRAYVIADNKLTELGEWDKDLLHLELSDLRAFKDEPDLIETLGFSQHQIQSIINKQTRANKKTPGDEDKEDQNTLLVKCDSEEQSEKLYNELTGEGYSVRILD